MVQRGQLDLRESRVFRDQQELLELQAQRVQRAQTVPLRVLLAQQDLRVQLAPQGQPGRLALQVLTEQTALMDLQQPLRLGQLQLDRLVHRHR